MTIHLVKQFNLFGMLRQSNQLLELERKISRLEFFRIALLGDGNPILNGEELSRLNKLGKKIWLSKQILAEQTAELKAMKTAYYKIICRQLNIGKRDSRKLVVGEYGEKTQ